MPYAMLGTAVLTARSVFRLVYKEILNCASVLAYPVPIAEAQSATSVDYGSQYHEANATAKPFRMLRGPL